MKLYLTIMAFMILAANCDESKKICKGVDYDSGFNLLAAHSSKLLFIGKQTPTGKDYIFSFDGTEARPLGVAPEDAIGIVGKDLFVSGTDSVYKAGKKILKKISGLTNATEAVSYQGDSYLAGAEGLARIEDNQAVAIDLSFLAEEPVTLKFLTVLDGILFFIAIDEDGLGALVSFDGDEITNVLADEDDISSVNPAFLHVHNNKLIFLVYNNISFGLFYSYEPGVGTEEISYLAAIYDIDEIQSLSDTIYFSRSSSIINSGVFEIIGDDVNQLSGSTDWSLAGISVSNNNLLFVHDEGPGLLVDGTFSQLDDWQFPLEVGYYPSTKLDGVAIFDGCKNETGGEASCFLAEDEEGEEQTTTACQGEIDGIECSLYGFDGSSVVSMLSGHKDLQYVTRGGAILDDLYYFEGQTDSGLGAFSVNSDGDVKNACFN